MSRARGMVEFLILLFIVSLFPKFVGLSETDQKNLNDANTLARKEAAVVRSVPVSGSPPNLTGYDALIPIPAAVSKQLHEDFEHYSRSAFYTNVSSLLKGHTKLMSPQPSPRPMDSPFEDNNLQNISFSQGKRPLSREKIGIWIRSHGESNGTSLLHAYLEFQSSQLGVDLSGVYSYDGKATLASSSLKFSGFHATPYLAGADAARDLFERPSDIKFGEFKELQANAVECEWVVQGVVHAHHASRHKVEEAEEELAHPRGAPIKGIPSVHFMGTIWSPDCGLAYHFTMKGERAERHAARTRKALTFAILGLIGLICLSAVFHKSLNTASKLCRVGFWSLALKSLTDGAVCIVALLISPDDSFGLSSMVIAILSLLLVGVYDLQLMVAVYAAQLTEDAANARAADHNSSVEIPSDQSIMNTIYTRYYLIIVIFFVSLSLLSFGDQVRRTYECVLLGIIYSFWWPQIWHSARRGTSIPFSMIWVLLVGLLRLAPTIYICMDRHNVGLHRHAPHVGMAVIAWQALQMFILFIQIWFGPRVFLPASLFSKGYDYHHLLIVSDVEANNDAELPPTIEPLQQRGKVWDEQLGCQCQTVPCAVCMYDVRLPLLEEASKAGPLILSEAQKYMITPCQHAFHTECLERWIHAKLSCPTCRCPLPPI